MFKDRIIAVHSNCYHGYSLDEAIDGISAAGFKYIELTATKGWTEHIFPNMAFEELYRLKDKLQAAGLSPISVSGHTNLMDKARIPDFVANMRLAHFYGCGYIVSSIGEAHLEDKAIASNAEVADQIQALIPYLEAYQLSLVLENHGEHSTGQLIKQIVDRVGSPLVKINFDTANGIYFAGADSLEDLRGCVGQVGHLHIKDKIGPKGEWNFPALGKGAVDLAGIFKLLDDADNMSPGSIEIEFTSGGSKSLAEVNQVVVDSYQYLRQIGMPL